MKKLRPSSLVCGCYLEHKLSQLRMVHSEATFAGCRAGRKRAQPGRWHGGRRRGQLASLRSTSQQCGARSPRRWPLQVR